MEIQQIDYKGTLVKYRLSPYNEYSKPLLMVHGWGGDEDSMWVFTSNIPNEFTLIAPAGLYASSQGGRSWLPENSSGLTQLEDLIPAINFLKDLLTNGPFRISVMDRVHLMGFSLGAALIYTYTILNPGKVASVAGLAGFLPAGTMSYQSEISLQGKKVYISHGIKDKIVSLTLAREAVRFFTEKGADVNYCEEDSEHKLSANCYRNLGQFYQQLV
jgi:phospholipase/carboxylesterase